MRILIERLRQWRPLWRSIAGRWTRGLTGIWSAGRCSRSCGNTTEIHGGEMKVVLFCGGLGTRLKEFSETIPKPMVEIGYRPVMWHLMRYYAHYGFKDFILCL